MDEQELPLEAGDRVLFLTDGMLERNAEGLDIPALMLASAHLHPREAIQYLTHAVLDAVGGELATTPPRCASTGTAARRATAYRTPAPNTGRSASALLILSPPEAESGLLATVVEDVRLEPNGALAGAASRATRADGRHALPPPAYSPCSATARP